MLRTPADEFPCELPTLRIDKFTRLVSAEQDRLIADKFQTQELIAEAKAFYRDIKHPGDGHVKSCGYDKTTKHSRDVHDSWGPISWYVAAFTPQHGWFQTSRIDVRMTTRVDTNLLTPAYLTIEAHKSRSVNCAHFNNRPREKHGQRDAGGIGFAIGSHGSDRRIVVYKKPNEVGAIEIQLKGAALRRCVKLAVDRAREQSIPLHEAFISVGRDEMESMLLETPFRTLAVFASAVSGRNYESATEYREVQSLQNTFFGLVDHNSGPGVPVLFSAMVAARDLVRVRSNQEEREGDDSTD